MAHLDKDLSLPPSIPGMIDAYQFAMAKIVRAYRDLEDAKQQLNSAFGQSAYMEAIDHYSRQEGEEAAKNIQKINTKKAWRVFIGLLGVDKFLSLERRKRLEDKIESGDLPEITLDNVTQELFGIIESARELEKEAVLEVANLLSPARKKILQGKYVTNDKNAHYAVGSKVILQYYVYNNLWGCSYVSVLPAEKPSILAIDRVFHLLDGAGVLRGYNGELCDAIEGSQDGNGETDYFTFRACKNGNLHLGFKRMDIVEKINMIANDSVSLHG